MDNNKVDCLSWDDVKAYKVMLGITKSEFKVLFHLVFSKDKKSIKQIIDFFPRDRTTIQKIVKNLFDKGFVVKEKYPSIDAQKLKDSKFRNGYKYVYYLDKSCFSKIIKPFNDAISELESIKHSLIDERKKCED